MPPRGVEQHRVIDSDMTAVRAQQAGNHVDRGGLAAAGATEQGRDARRRAGEGHLRGKCAALLAHLDIEHSGASTAELLAQGTRQPFGQHQAGEPESERGDGQARGGGVAIRSLQGRVQRQGQGAGDPRNV